MRGIEINKNNKSPIFLKTRKNEKRKLEEKSK